MAAVYFHPDLDVADAQLAVAQAAIRTAAQRPNPSFNLTPQFNATNANPTAWTIGTAINLLLELFGKREARTDEAKALTEAARFDVANVSWQVRGRVRAAMLALWGAEQRAGLIARRRDLQTELAALVERRLAAGDVSALDAGRERANRDILVLAVSDAARDIADARVSLASAIGVPVHALTGLVLDYAALADAKQPSDVATLRKTALTARSDVRASLARYAASEAALKLQLANRLPNLSIGPGYQYDQGDNKFSLSLQTDLPVFNANGGPVAEAMAHRREAAANFTALQAGIITEIDRAEAARKSTGASLVAADTLAAQQADRARRNMRVFNAGAIDRVTLLTGEIDYAAGQESRLQALIAERTALGQLEDALRVPIFTKALPAASTNRTMP
ncbi:TolC family protein [uncultured Sphingomonas sp.]|uniref:TolC family protein n=1 Tax=uncultured Sphingomonas sp. TaxID=158754 RepID=UPI0026378DB6|nr:TolC family protein [uncultured Sphingomonas sp.]